MKISEIQKQVHALAKDKGWWSETKPNPKERAGLHMLMVSEIAEATECLRDNQPPIWQNGALYGDKIEPDSRSFTGEKLWSSSEKPEGELVELADCIIRILDYCEAMGFDLERAIEIKHKFNVTRAVRHGGKVF